MPATIDSPCPCHSGATYAACCSPQHRGQKAATPAALMRSRYSAYAMGNVAYIISTTDPRGPAYEANNQEWRASIEEFCRATEFFGLAILAHDTKGNTSWVTFRASLRQQERDVSFAERSEFVRRSGRWLYHAGAPTPSH